MTAGPAGGRSLELTTANLLGGIRRHLTGKPTAILYPAPYADVGCS